MAHWRENSNMMRQWMSEYERDLDDIIKADRRLKWGVYLAIALVALVVGALIWGAGP